MNFYLVALMALLNGAPEGFEKPMAYVFTNPTFSSWDECRAYAVIMNEDVMKKLWDEFGAAYRPHMISCVTEDTVKEIEKMNKKGVTT